MDPKAGAMTFLGGDIVDEQPHPSPGGNNPSIWIAAS